MWSIYRISAKYVYSNRVILPLNFLLLLSVSVTVWLWKSASRYMESKDLNQYLANIWCRQRSAHSKHFLYALAVPASADADAEESIVNALNDDSAFAPIMLDYIDEAAKHRCD